MTPSWTSFAPVEFSGYGPQGSPASPGGQLWQTIAGGHDSAPSLFSFSGAGIGSALGGLVGGPIGAGVGGTAGGLLGGAGGSVAWSGLKGAGLGALGGAGVGATIGALGGPIGAAGGALIGAGVGATAGVVKGIVDQGTKIIKIWERLSQVSDTLSHQYGEWSSKLARTADNWDRTNERINQKWAKAIEGITARVGKDGQGFDERWNAVKISVFKSFEPLMNKMLDWLEKIGNFALRIFETLSSILREFMSWMRLIFGALSDLVKLPSRLTPQPTVGAGLTPTQSAIVTNSANPLYQVPGGAIFNPSTWSAAGSVAKQAVKNLTQTIPGAQVFNSDLWKDAGKAVGKLWDWFDPPAGAATLPPAGGSQHHIAYQGGYGPTMNALARGNGQSKTPYIPNNALIPIPTTGMPNTPQPIPNTIYGFLPGGGWGVLNSGGGTAQKINNSTWQGFLMGGQNKPSTTQPNSGPGKNSDEPASVATARWLVAHPSQYDADTVEAAKGIIQDYEDDNSPSGENDLGLPSVGGGMNWGTARRPGSKAGIGHTPPRYHPQGGGSTPRSSLTNPVADLTKDLPPHLRVVQPSKAPEDLWAKAFDKLTERSDEGYKSWYDSLKPEDKKEVDGYVAKGYTLRSAYLEFLTWHKYKIGPGTDPTGRDIAENTIVDKFQTQHEAEWKVSPSNPKNRGLSQPMSGSTTASIPSMRTRPTTRPTSPTGGPTPPQGHGSQTQPPTTQSTTQGGPGQASTSKASSSAPHGHEGRRDQGDCPVNISITPSDGYKAMIERLILCLGRKLTDSELEEHLDAYRLQTEFTYA